MRCLTVVCLLLLAGGWPGAGASAQPAPSVPAAAMQEVAERRRWECGGETRPAFSIRLIRASTMSAASVRTSGHPLAILPVQL